MKIQETDGNIVITLNQKDAATLFGTVEGLCEPGSRSTATDRVKAHLRPIATLMKVFRNSDETVRREGVHKEDN